MPGNLQKLFHVLFSGLAMLGAAAGPAAAAEESVTLERFGVVRITRPSGAAAGFVILLNGGKVDDRAERVTDLMVAADYVVASIDTPHYLEVLQREEDGCLFIGGEFERVGQLLQNQARLPKYQLPILVGTGAGGAVAYVVGAQAPKGFRGVFSFDFCPELGMTDDFCADSDPPRRRTSPVALRFQPAVDIPLQWDFIPAAVCPVPMSEFEPYRREPRPSGSPEDRLRDALKSFSERKAMPEGAGLGLPLVELPAIEHGKSYLVVFLSGDGGWAGIDRDLGEYLNKAGVSVIGFDSLRYFWKVKTPEELGAALTKVIDTYTKKWVKRKVVIIGYSFGADVLSFGVNALPPELRKLVSDAIFLNPVSNATFEVHLTDWLGLSSGDEGRPVQPQVEAMRGVHMLCLWGDEEKADSLCPRLSRDLVTSVSIPGDHHFDGDYEKAADVILKFLGN